jgi:hypothetical protein
MTRRRSGRPGPHQPADRDQAPVQPRQPVPAITLMDPNPDALAVALQPSGAFALFIARRPVATATVKP